jgi:hypothetical protein
MFKAFKLGVGKLLDALEPQGEVRPPDLDFSEGPTPAERAFLTEALSTPEAAAERVAQSTLYSLFTAPLATEDLKARLHNLKSPEWPGVGEHLDRFVEEFHDEFYDMSDARQDLGMDETREPKS